MANSLIDTALLVPKYDIIYKTPPSMCGRASPIFTVICMMQYLRWRAGPKDNTKSLMSLFAPSSGSCHPFQWRIRNWWGWKLDLRKRGPRVDGRYSVRNSCPPRLKVLLTPQPFGHFGNTMTYWPKGARALVEKALPRATLSTRGSVKPLPHSERYRPMVGGWIGPIFIRPFTRKFQTSMHLRRKQRPIKLTWPRSSVKSPPI